MNYKKIFLKNISNLKIGINSFIEIYSCDKNVEVDIDPRPVMIVCPGGGYAMCSYREAEPIALRYLSEGFNCVILNYSTKTLFPIPQLELAITIDYIRNNCTKYNMSRDYINIVGFSAGAHLAASYSLYYKEYAEMMNVDFIILKPFSLTLAYPVISKKFANNSGSFFNLSLGDEKLFDKFDIVNNLTDDFPPTYVWTTKKDGYIDPENSILLVEEFKKHKIKYKFTLFNEGIHGGSLFNHAVYDDSYNFEATKENKIWVYESVDFIFNLIKEDKIGR